MATPKTVCLMALGTLLASARRWRRRQAANVAGSAAGRTPPARCRRGCGGALFQDRGRARAGAASEGHGRTGSRRLSTTLGFPRSCLRDVGAARPWLCRNPDISFPQNSHRAVTGTVPHLRISENMIGSTWGRPSCCGGPMSRKAIDVKEFVLATTAALIVGVLLSVGAVYGLNRIFDMYDPPKTLSSG